MTKSSVFLDAEYIGSGGTGITRVKIYKKEVVDGNEVSTQRNRHRTVIPPSIETATWMAPIRSHLSAQGYPMSDLELETVVDEVEAERLADPYYVTIEPGEIVDATGRTEVSVGSLLSGTSIIALIVGQSNNANRGTDPSYVTANPDNIFNFDIHTGKAYKAVNPLIGATSDKQSAWLRASDNLINTAVCDTMILVPLPIGGTHISQWAPDGDMNRRLTVAAARLDDAGLLDASAIKVVYMHIGESDAQSGTSQAAYEASQLAFIADVQSKFPDWIIIICKASFINDELPAGSSAVLAAQEAGIDDVTVFQGVNTDAFTSREDGTHWNTTSIAQFANAIRQDIETYAA